jgi:hypothetical protein
LHVPVTVRCGQAQVRQEAVVHGVEVGGVFRDLLAEVGE